MIRDVASLLESLQYAEMRLIDRSNIQHAPTIGEQYERLTADLLGRMIPEELQLEVVRGFVEGIDGTCSGQVDCMLVRGKGTPIPYSSSVKWPVRDVLAVFEVKKTLFSNELTDAHKQLMGVLEKFWDYAETLAESEKVDVAPALDVYGHIVGEPAPDRAHLAELPFHKKMIYRTLVVEQLAPVRITFGYYGYQTQYTLRKGFVDFMKGHQKTSGYAGSALPDLIVCGPNCLVKLNGHPYWYPLRGDEWLWYASSAENPLLFLLNLILTKLSYETAAPEWYSRDLSAERIAPLLWAKAVERGQISGWDYKVARLTRKQLESVPAVCEEWKPVVISSFQFAVLRLIEAQGSLSPKDLEKLRASEAGGYADNQIEELTKNRLLGWAGDQLIFLGRGCAFCSTPWGEMMAGDIDDGRLGEWISKEAQRRRWVASGRPPL